MHEGVHLALMGGVPVQCRIDEQCQTFELRFEHVRLSSQAISLTFTPGEEFAPGHGWAQVHIDRLGDPARRIFDALSDDERDGVARMTFDHRTLRVRVKHSSWLSEPDDRERQLQSLIDILAKALGFIPSDSEDEFPGFIAA